ncbi:MAG: hypothetical protein RIT07_1392, partial [Bacteroidota bacterium]
TGIAANEILQKQGSRQITLGTYLIQNRPVFIIVEIPPTTPDIKISESAQSVGLVNLKIQTYKPFFFHDNNFEYVVSTLEAALFHVCIRAC